MTAATLPNSKMFLLLTKGVSEIFEGSLFASKLDPLALFVSIPDLGQVFLNVLFRYVFILLRLLITSKDLGVFIVKAAT